MKIKKSFNILVYIITLLPLVAAFFMVLSDYYTRTEEMQLQSIDGWLKENESSVNEFISYQSGQIAFLEDVYQLPKVISAVNEGSTETLNMLLGTVHTAREGTTNTYNISQTSMMDEYISTLTDLLGKYTSRHKTISKIYLFHSDGMPLDKNTQVFGNVTTAIIDALKDPATGRFYYDFVKTDNSSTTNSTNGILIARPLLNEKSVFVGGIAAFIPLRAMDAFLDTRKNYPGQLSIFSSQGDYLFSDKKHNLRNINQLTETNEYRKLVEMVLNAQQTNKGRASFENKNGTDVLFNYIKLRHSGWLIVHSVTAQETGVFSKQIMWKFLGLTVLIFLITWLTINYVGKLIFVPIEHIVMEMRRINANRGRLRISYNETDNELSELTAECNKMLAQLRRERDNMEFNSIHKNMVLAKRKVLLFELDWEKRIITLQDSKYIEAMGLKKEMSMMEFEKVLRLSAYDISKIRHQEEILMSTGKPVHGEAMIFDEAENEVWWSYDMVTRPESDGTVRQIIGVCVDSTLERREHKRLQALKNADTQNHVLTKAVFFQSLERATDSLKKTNDLGALFVIGIDNYRAQNTSFGYEFGDQMIAFIGRSLAEIIPTNTGFLGRHGGGEFYIFITDKYQVSYERLNQFAISIREQLASGFKIGKSHERVAVRCNIGVAICPDDSEDFSELFLLASKAMSIAKKDKKTGIEFCSVKQDQPDEDNT